MTNAAGGLNSNYAVGDLVLLNDARYSPSQMTKKLANAGWQHIFLAGLAGNHPLRGPNDESFGVRFPPLSDAYDLELRRHAHQTWKQITDSTSTPKSTRRLHEGTYAYVGGPT